MLIDTAGWLCYRDVGDSRHRSAVSYFEAAPVKLTHTFILAEFVALAQVRGQRRQATLDFVAAILDSADVEVVWIDEVRYRASLLLLQHRPDKGYSLCDAISFVLMRERGLRAD